MGKLSENRPFIETVFGELDKAGMLTKERLEKRSNIVNEKIARCEPPFDRPFFLVDPDGPEDRKAVFWPVPALERAIKSTSEGVFIPPQ
ncbi:MAG: hypothetical protein ABIU05_04285 [Nitrospirales bacterium]